MMDRRSISNRGAGLLILLTAFVMAQAQAQTLFAPQPPVDPASERDCADFIQSYKSYLDRLHEQFSRCSRLNIDAPPARWTNGFRCTGGGARVPQACQMQSNEWSCATIQTGDLLNACLDAVHRKSADAAKRLSADLNTSLERAALETYGKSLPNSLAKWWLKEGTNPALMKGLQVAGFGRIALRMDQIMTSNGDPAQKAAQLGDLFASNGSLISREMTRTAVRLVSETGRAALGDLDKALAEFGAPVAVEAADVTSREPKDRPMPPLPSSVRAAPEPEPAAEKSDWTCFSGYDQCTAYCRSETGASGNSGWCGGICSEAGTGNMPKPSRFGSQRCYHAR
jgi:hypothetical protein